MMAMVVVTIGIAARLVDLNGLDRRVLGAELRKVCCQTITVLLSETVRLGSYGDKWLIHFRLHV